MQMKFIYPRLSRAGTDVVNKQCIGEFAETLAGKGLPLVFNIWHRKII
jgi:hypothetical protein